MIKSINVSHPFTLLKHLNSTSILQCYSVIVCTLIAPPFHELDLSRGDIQPQAESAASRRCGTLPSWSSSNFTSNRPRNDQPTIARRTDRSEKPVSNECFKFFHLLDFWLGDLAACLHPFLVPQPQSLQPDSDSNGA